MKMKIVDIIKKSSTEDMAKLIGALGVMLAEGLSAEEAFKLEYQEISKVLQSEMEIDYKQTNDEYNYGEMPEVDRGTTAALEELKKYKDLEKQGLLIRLPVKVGDTVYRICPKCNDKHDSSCENCAWCRCSAARGCDVYGLWDDGQYPPDKCTIVPYKVTWNYIPNLMEHYGKTVFLTKEEADEALKKMKESEG